MSSLPAGAIPIATLNGRTIAVLNQNGVVYSIYASGGALGDTELLVSQTGSILGGGNLAIINGRDLFVINDGGHLYNVYGTDGTASGTQLLISTTGNIVGGGTLGFIGNKELIAVNDGGYSYRVYSTDGTSAGTQLLVHQNSSDGLLGGGYFATTSSRNIFVLNDGGRTYSVYGTDGTAAGTQLLVQATGSEIGGGSFGTFNNKDIFVLNDSGHTYRVYGTDGTTAGTQLLINVTGDALGGGSLGYANGKEIFAVNDGGHTYRVYGSDGTAAGTQLLVSTTGSAVGGGTIGSANNRQLFVLNDSGHIYNVYGTDGTSAGTQLLVSATSDDLLIGGGSFTTVNNRDIFVVNEGGSVLSVYGSDGTKAGTQLLAQEHGTLLSSYNLVSVGQWDFFEISSGQVFETNGTASGTRILSSIPYGSTISLAQSDGLKATLVITPQNASSETVWLDTQTGAIQTAGDMFVRAAGSSGSWGDAASWVDQTTGGTHAVPSGVSSVTIGTLGSGVSTSLTGSGSATYLYVDSPVTFSGSFDFGSADLVSGLTQVVNGTLNIDHALYTSSTLSLTNSALSVDGVYVGSGEILASQSSHLQFAGLGMPAYSQVTLVDWFVDPTSSIEVGSIGNAAAGSITIDSGISVRTEGTLGASNVINNGTIEVAAGNSLLLNGGTFSISSAGSGSFTFYSGNSVLSGDGEIDIDAGATLELYDLAVDPSQRIKFTGEGGTLSIGNTNSLSAVPTSLNGVISGFDESDAIKVQGIVTSVSYSNGVLSVFDGSVNVANLTLEGNYSGEGFKVIPIGSYQSEIELTANPSQIPPVIMAPASEQTQYGDLLSVSGISIADSAPQFLASGSNISVILSDRYGLLNASSSVPGGGGTIFQSGTSLVISGTLAQVNADLTTLTYRAIAPASDSISIIANDENGSTATQTIAISVPPIQTDVPVVVNALHDGSFLLAYEGATQSGDTTGLADTSVLQLVDHAGNLVGSAQSSDNPVGYYAESTLGGILSIYEETAQASTGLSLKIVAQSFDASGNVNAPSTLLLQSTTTSQYVLPIGLFSAANGGFDFIYAQQDLTQLTSSNGLAYYDLKLSPSGSKDGDPEALTLKPAGIDAMIGRNSSDQGILVSQEVSPSGSSVSYGGLVVQTLGPDFSASDGAVEVVAGDGATVFVPVAVTADSDGDFHVFWTDESATAGASTALGAPETYFEQEITPDGELVGTRHQFVLPEGSTIAESSDGSFLAAYGTADYSVTEGYTNIQITAEMLDPACFCRGTLILSETGEVAVEDLKIGDRIETLFNGVQAIKWIGRRSYSGRFARMHKNILPVRIRADALAPGLPKRDLFLSPRHALYLAHERRGYLVEVADLVNKRSIEQLVSCETVEYFHIELETHDVLVAEGVFAETYLDDGNRKQFHNASDYRDLYGDESTDEVRYCSPRLFEGDLIEKIRSTFVERAEEHFGDRKPIKGWAA